MSGSPKITLPSPRKGFTLIELLVVVAIIALLVSILMPALGEAERQARMTVCAANFHQVGVGLAIYVSQFNGQYFPHWWHPTIFYGQESFGPDGGPMYDNRQNLYDIVGGATDIYYCVMSDSVYIPENSEVSADPDDPWTKYANNYYVQDAGSAYRHNILETRILVGYGPSAGPSAAYDWSNTKNPDGESPRLHPGHPGVVTVFDYHHSAEGWRSGEFGGYQVFGWEPGSTLYGDGHVELPEEWENLVIWDKFGTPYEFYY